MPPVSVFGALVGLFNGIFVAWLEINPFVVTLGSLNICLGLATTISGGRPVFNVPDVFSRLLYNGVLIPGISVPLTPAVTVCLLLYFLLGHTVFGRSLYIIGSNPRAAYLAGLPKKGYLTAAYITCSLLAAFGALMLTARTGSGSRTSAAASCSRVSPPRSSAASAFREGPVASFRSFWYLFVTMLSNAMNLLEVGGYVQQILLGCIIIGAIFLDRIRVTWT